MEIAPQEDADVPHVADELDGSDLDHAGGIRKDAGPEQQDGQVPSGVRRVVREYRSGVGR